MNDLIVCATVDELAPFLDEKKILPNLRTGDLRECGHFDLLVCGVGVLAAAYHLGSVLSNKKYNLIMNFGIAGSFKKELPIRSIVAVREEILSDLGAESGENDFLDIFDLGLIEKNNPPFSNGVLKMETTKLSSLVRNLPQVRSVTVNRVLSHEKSIKWVKDKYSPEVVNMEGAAVFYSALSHSTPCLQVRAISDLVGTRDKSKWDIPGAITELNLVVSEIYDKRYNLS